MGMLFCLPTVKLYSKNGKGLTKIEHSTRFKRIRQNLFNAWGCFLRGKEDGIKVVNETCIIRTLI